MWYFKIHVNQQAVISGEITLNQQFIDSLDCTVFLRQTTLFPQGGAKSS